ncbi:cutinase domain protein [Mycobacterium avium subsp. avium 2285 (R)]|nr:cutinase domain protein [Mycobacterium avium subsp. avium 2285 (R)]
MPTNARRKRRRTLAWIAALSVAGVVLLVIVAAVVVLRGREAPPSAVPPGVLPPTSTTGHPHKPRPASQDASCPDVLLVNVPGTWESARRTTRGTRCSSRTRCCTR